MSTELQLLREWREVYGGSTLPNGKPCSADLEARTDALLAQPESAAQPTGPRPPKPKECEVACPPRQVCDHCQWPAASSPTWEELDAIRKGKSDIDLAEQVWHAIERERLANMRADQVEEALADANERGENLHAKLREMDAAQSATQRSDMVLVPRHPSYQMLSAGMAAALHVPPDEIQARHVYLAMLAALDGGSAGKGQE